MEITYKKIYQDYIIKEKSVLELKKEYNISYKAVEKILKNFNITKRTLKEATNTKRTRDKYKNTCETKFGKGITNASQSKEIKKKKAETFLKHYGVDNIWKDPDYYIWLDKYMMENYGKKRTTSPEKISESRIDFFKKNGDRAQEIRKQLSKKAKESWAKLTEEEQILKMVNMRKKIPKEYYSSKLEYRIKGILDKNFIWNQHQFFMGKYSWDLFLGNRLILEINGDFWHGNPNIYNKKDLLNHKGDTVLVEDLWKKDKIKKDYAESKGFNVFYLWEKDINKYTDADILEIIKGEIYENKINKKD